MRECKIRLPFMAGNKNLNPEHEQLRMELIRRFGYVATYSYTGYWKDTSTNKLVIEFGVEYVVSIWEQDFPAFRTICIAAAHRCKQKDIYIVCDSRAELIDTANTHEPENWQHLANERLAERDRLNPYWVSEQYKKSQLLPAITNIDAEILPPTKKE